MACCEIKAHDATRKAYWRDYVCWHAFYTKRGFNPVTPKRAAVGAFHEHLKLLPEAPKTRARRMSALSSICGALCRTENGDEQPIVRKNPFSPSDGPDRDGHSDQETTRGYDRESWRGLETVQAMPEVEDAATSAESVS